MMERDDAARGGADAVAVDDETDVTYFVLIMVEHFDRSPRERLIISLL